MDCGLLGSQEERLEEGDAFAEDALEAAAADDGDETALVAQVLTSFHFANDPARKFLK